MDVKSIEILLQAIPLLTVEDRVFDVDRTLLETRFEAVIFESQSLLFRRGPNPRFQNGRYHLFSHWTINGALALSDPGEFPDLRVETGTRRQRVTAWWRDVGTVWPPPPDLVTPAVPQIAVVGVSASNGPLLQPTDEVPIAAVDPPSAWSPPGSATVSTRGGKVTITAKSELASTRERFRAWVVPGGTTTKSDTPVVTAEKGESGIWLAFYDSPPRPPFKPPRISKWPPDIIIHPAGPDPGPMAGLTHLTAMLAEGLVGLSAEVATLRRQSDSTAGRVTPSPRRRPRAPKKPSRRRRKT